MLLMIENHHRHPLTSNLTRYPSKNVLATIMQSFICLGLISITWVLFGYSLSFGPDIGGFIGNLQYFALPDK